MNAKGVATLEVFGKGCWSRALSDTLSIVVPGRALLLSRSRAISLAKLLTGPSHSACRGLSIHRGSIGWKTVLHSSFETGEPSRGDSRLELSWVQDIRECLLVLGSKRKCETASGPALYSAQARPSGALAPALLW